MVFNVHSHIVASLPASPICYLTLRTFVRKFTVLHISLSYESILLQTSHFRTQAQKWQMPNSKSKWICMRDFLSSVSLCQPYHYNFSHKSVQLLVPTRSAASDVPATVLSSHPHSQHLDHDLCENPNFDLFPCGCF